MNNPHWHILGVGAIGGLCATQLADAGCSVTLLLRQPEHYSGQLTLERHGQITHYQLPAAAISDSGPALEYLIVATKAPFTRTALEPLRARLQPTTKILLLQNGMGMLDELQAAGFPGQFSQAVITHGAYRITPSQVVHAGQGHTWVDAAWLAECAHYPDRWQAEHDMTQRLWHKLAVNCAINPLTALLNCRNGYLSVHPEARSLLQRACQELQPLLSHYVPQLDAATLFEQVLAVAQATSNNWSSMQQDVQAQRRSEIDYLTGYALRQAERIGLELPMHRTLYQLIRLRPA